MLNRSVLIVLLSLILSGCVQRIDYSKNLQTEYPRSEKLLTPEGKNIVKQTDLYPIEDLTEIPSDPLNQLTPELD